MTAIQEELARVAAALPEDRARQVLNFARILAVLPPGVDYQDSWSEEDMRDATLHSFRRFAEEHGEEDWGIDYEALREDKACPPREM